MKNVIILNARETEGAIVTITAQRDANVATDNSNAATAGSFLAGLETTSPAHMILNGQFMMPEGLVSFELDSAAGKFTSLTLWKVIGDGDDALHELIIDLLDEDNAIYPYVVIYFKEWIIKKTIGALQAQA